MSGIKSAIQTQKLQNEEQLNLFIEALVLKITKVPLNMIAQEKREEIINNILDSYFQFVEAFILEKGGKTQLTQYKIFQSSEDLNILQKFTDLQQNLQLANQEFLNLIYS